MNRAELRRKAEAARDTNMDCGDNSCAYAKKKGGMRTNGGCRCLDIRNISYYRYVQTSNPAAVIALLDELEKAEKERDKERRIFGELQQGISELEVSLREEKQQVNDRNKKLKQERDTLLTDWRSMRDAITAMVSACKQRNIDVEYVVEGGLMGQPQKVLSKVSLLDHLHQTLVNLKHKEPT